MEFGKCLECGALTHEYYGMTDDEHRDWHKRIEAKFEKLEELIQGEQK